VAEIYKIVGHLKIDYRAREWCKLPYPNHPKGCPNYNKNPECPPQAPRIEDWLDLNRQHWFIVVEFDLDAFAKRMKEKHPGWSDKQCRCCLYWQNIPRKELKLAIE
jgi:predicted metal-binding protein